MCSNAATDIVRGLRTAPITGLLFVSALAVATSAVDSGMRVAPDVNELNEPEREVRSDECDRSCGDDGTDERLRPEDMLVSSIRAEFATEFAAEFAADREAEEERRAELPTEDADDGTDPARYFARSLIDGSIGGGGGGASACGCGCGLGGAAFGWGEGERARRFESPKAEAAAV